jgi:hypothetical protein
MNPAGDSESLTELETAAVRAWQRVEFLWQASNRNWRSIQLALEDLSAAARMIIDEQALDEATAPRSPK